MANTPRDWPARVERWRDAATLVLVLAGAAAVALAFRVDPFDMFRTPKAMVLRAVAILLAAVNLAAWILGAPLPRLRRWHLIPLGAFAAIGVLTMTSTNRALSADALASAAATLIVFFATVSAARRHGWILLSVPLAAAVINALLVIVEELNWWMPFGVRTDVSHHMQCTALVGNPNEVGSYLAAAALACIAFFLSTSRRSLLAVLFVLLAGLVATQTLTAMIAFGAAAFAMFAMASWRSAMRAALAAIVVGAILVAVLAPLRSRMTTMIGWAQRGEYNAIFTERFTAFASAWSMFTARPLTGVGPGVFAWRYYDAKIESEERYPSLRTVYNRGFPFGEVHNDHLQVLAEGGVLGYAAFAAVFLALAALSFRSANSFVRRLALPLAIFCLVLSLAQFPLETTVVRMLLVHLAALCAGWSDR